MNVLSTDWLVSRGVARALTITFFDKEVYDKYFAPKKLAPDDDSSSEAR